LWDVQQGEDGEWTEVLIDDALPCRKRGPSETRATPLSCPTTPKGEVWPCLLEKAFAKFLGSYADLAEGLASFTWQALTGSNDCQTYTRDAEGLWEVCHNDVCLQQRKICGSRRNRKKMAMVPRPGKLSGDAMFEVLKSCGSRNTILGAGIGTSTDPNVPEREGLATGHSYPVVSTIDCRLVSGDDFRLLCLRNNWGDRRCWSGDWSVGSPLWDDNPAVRAHVNLLLEQLTNVRSTPLGGLFWMPWHDFCRLFDNVQVCEVS